MIESYFPEALIFRAFRELSEKSGIGGKVKKSKSRNKS